MWGTAFKASGASEAGVLLTIEKVSLQDVINGTSRVNPTVTNLNITAYMPPASDMVKALKMNMSIMSMIWDRLRCWTLIFCSTHFRQQIEKNGFRHSITWQIRSSSTHRLAYEQSNDLV